MQLSNTSLKQGPWTQPRTVAVEPLTVQGAAIRLAIGLGVAALFAAIGWRTASILVAVLATAFGVPSLASQAARTAIDGFFVRLGGWIGLVLRYVLLVPVFVFGFTAVRGWLRLTGKDPLQLRDRGETSLWLQSDSDDRKTAHVDRLFATEPLRGSGLSFSALLVLAIAALLLGEVVARVAGYGDPVLYRSDDLYGYMPAPDQAVRRRGNDIAINAFGMRGPTATKAPAAGTHRILMLGDSTLYGGSYTDQDELYSRRLEGLLTERRGSPVEVLAMGVNGWGPFHELGYVQRYGTFGAQQAVVCLPYGDVFRLLTTMGQLPYMPESAPPTFALQEIAEHLRWRHRTQLLGPPTAEQKAERGERGVAAYVELAKLLQAGGAQVRFEVLPSRSAATGEAVPELEQQWLGALTQALKPHGVEVGYALEAMRTHGTAAYQDAVHLSPAGHEHYAAALADALGGAR